MAQASCPEGKVLGWDQATCCWPGQNVGPFGCTGPPTSCPVGLVITGEGCDRPDSAAAARNAYNPALLDPSKATETAPDEFTVRFKTTQGDILIDVTRAWAPNGADRFYNLVRIGFYNQVAFFRVVSGFMAQVGIHGDPKVSAVWRESVIQDDPVVESNLPGYVTYAMAGPNTRTTQLFFNFADNHRLDRDGFSPFGRVRDMAVLENLYDGYGEGAPRGRGPNQLYIQDRGNSYLKTEFPDLDWILEATIEPAAKPAAADPAPADPAPAQAAPAKTPEATPAGD
ncbi:MAG: peptidylprolyl isomerase [Deltaproteobacteria bacterium]|nr:peptidylprolyl isomerase [Deltaproteobacteria bacterium]